MDNLDNLVIYVFEVFYVLTTKGSLLEMSFDQNPIGGVVKGLPSTLKVNKRTLDFIDKVGNPRVMWVIEFLTRGFKISLILSMK